jgi:hypothetical protein
LEIFCDGSGQKVNKDKSSIFFGNHCANAIKDEVMQKIGVHSEALNDSYLGMPTEVGRSPVSTFRFLYDRVWKRMNGCSGKPMSRAGKETFIKAVIQAIPSFIMSCFQLPVTTCEVMRKSIANHWWGMENGKKKMHWRSWQWVSTPKSLGGMGFRDLELFNQAMLARQDWCLLTDPSSLCARVLKGRYYPNCSFWEAPRPRCSSYTWRIILFGRDLLKTGVRWGIGDGSKTKIQTDNWISGVQPSMLKPLVPLLDNQTVDTLILDGSRSWDTDLIETLFSEEVAAKIVQIPISRFGDDDFLSWPNTRFGSYTVRSGYNLARSEMFSLHRSKAGSGFSSTTEDDSRLWKSLWAIKAPGKMKITLWRLAHDCLPCGHQLQIRQIPASPTCYFCGRHETIEHTLLFCQFANEIWEAIREVHQLSLGRKHFTSPRVWVMDLTLVEKGATV